MRSLTLRSPAKVNLFLKVINKRPDGYHNLVTLFERIDLCDELRFSLNSRGTIRLVCNDPQVPLGRKNLVYKVAQKLKEDFQVPHGITIHIKKRIPVAAGLAGGSSNAATTLLGLNKIWKLSLNREELVAYAKRIGADVAFFLYDSSWALGTERGDKIQPFSSKIKLWHVVVTPRLKMYSRVVFEGLSLKKGGRTNLLTKKRYNVNILRRLLGKNDLYYISQLLCNDLEARVFQLCPRLMKLKERIRELNTCGVSLSGSGPSIFCLTNSQKSAQHIRDVLKKRYRRVFVVRTY
ncbi:MAG: 4-(cytidine 5'-diphospho)-2-C-methyl-D-erythritol kinase [Omnitrophica WOR_2 bacterium RIFCSPHIGHO2_01_FULL_48_9]|nr:MAG: 4-(cytidine 5'-diphospho)-2-C-methyl-D-erythritol kinase [Omnitrophica WOR_2 bacterium RIFCSPHIGHO2_02_FULL_48_11]OGX33765.1 MAG: 4-(cytidine 5'-diphospho)-2-C-methyl-D-erythritol kinase [Omnitrophica WOR_2 bacterium RIFCSPHIGHO2_01_FULL_48_9]